VEGEAGVAAGKYKTVATRPFRVSRVVPQETLEQQVGRGCEAHGRTRVPRARLLHRVHGQRADHIHGSTVQVGPLKRADVGLRSHRNLRVLSNRENSDLEGPPAASAPRRTTPSRMIGPG